VSVSRTVSEIFSVKEWRDLETGGKGCSKSLKMAPFDRPYATFCWSAIVNNNNIIIKCIYIAKVREKLQMRWLTVTNGTGMSFLNLFLNVASVMSGVRSSAERLFHTRGPWTVKLRSP